MKNIIIIFLTATLSYACQTGPVPDPESDSPLILGDTVDTPWGCVLWRRDNSQKCCYLERIDETIDDSSGWELDDWDC